MAYRNSRRSNLSNRRQRARIDFNLGTQSSNNNTKKRISPESKKYVSNLYTRRQSTRRRSTRKKNKRRRKYTPRLSPIEENWREGSENSPGRTDIWKKN